MIPEYQLLAALKSLFIDTLASQLAAEIPGLQLTQVLPEDKANLPTIVISCEKVTAKNSGIGGILKINQPIDGGDTVTRADRITGEMVFGIWFDKSAAAAQSGIDRAVELLNNLLSGHRNTLRSRGLLALDLINITSLKSSNDMRVWLISDAEALGKDLIYTFIFEYIDEKTPAEGIIRQVRINSGIG